MTTTTKPEADLADLFGPVISTYTRAQAIEDGVLVDLTEWASADRGFRGGFTCPVAVTAAVWSMIEGIPASLVGLADVRGRAHDVLWMASLAVRAAARRNAPEALFKVILPTRGTRTRNHVLKVHTGAGDAGELVVTIMLPHED